MYVDEETGRNLGQDQLTHADKTYYFCSDQCVKVFEEQPEKYVEQKKQTSGHAAMPEMENGWADLLKPVQTGQGIEAWQDGSRQRRQTGHPRKSAGTRGDHRLGRR